MGDLSRLVFLRIDLPNFLDPQSISLRVTVFPKIEVLLDDLGERTVCTFGDQGALGVELHAGFETFFTFPLSVQPDVSSPNTFDRLAILCDDQAGPREPCINFYAEFLGSFSQPGRQPGKAEDVVASVGHLRWVREREGRGGCEETHRVGCSGLSHGWRIVHVHEIGEELVERSRLDDGSGEDVRACSSRVREIFSH